MLTGHNILCISSIDWDFNWQGHQEIMTTLAAQGNRVLFVENTGVRSLRVSDVSRIRNRIRNWWRGTKGFREERRNLFVYSPVVLPFPYSLVARWINRTFLLRALRRWMRAADFHRPIVWTFLPTPLARDLIRELDPCLTIYYCIDNFASTSYGARKIIRSENQAFKEADLVFVTAERLLERAARFNKHVHYFPFGVNYEAFERVRVAPDAVADDLKLLPRPVVGFIGGLNSWMDQPLVCAVADAMPEATVAMVGPAQTDISALRLRRNIHLFGARPHAELPAYIKGFDVGIAPYLLNEHRNGSSRPSICTLPDLHRRRCFHPASNTTLQKRKSCRRSRFPRVWHPPISSSRCRRPALATTSCSCVRFCSATAGAGSFSSALRTICAARC